MKGKIIDTTETYGRHVLNTDKVESLEDCKKILQFLCGLAIKPLPNGVEYGGFSEVEKYFDQETNHDTTMGTLPHLRRQNKDENKR